MLNEPSPWSLGDMLNHITIWHVKWTLTLVTWRYVKSYNNITNKQYQSSHKIYFVCLRKKESHHQQGTCNSSTYLEAQGKSIRFKAKRNIWASPSTCPFSAAIPDSHPWQLILLHWTAFLRWVRRAIYALTTQSLAPDQQHQCLPFRNSDPHRTTSIEQLCLLERIFHMLSWKYISRGFYPWPRHEFEYLNCRNSILLKTTF